MVGESYNETIWTYLKGTKIRGTYFRGNLFLRFFWQKTAQLSSREIFYFVKSAKINSAKYFFTGFSSNFEKMLNRINWQKVWRFYDSIWENKFREIFVFRQIRENNFREINFFRAIREICENNFPRNLVPLRY